MLKVKGGVLQLPILLEKGDVFYDIYTGEVEEITVNNNPNIIKDARGWGFIVNGAIYRFEDYAETIFLSKKVAEKRLAELEDNNG